jgi:hypothetical protein
LLSWFPSTILLLEAAKAQQSPLHSTTSPFKLVSVVLEGQYTKRNFNMELDYRRSTIPINSPLSMLVMQRERVGLFLLVAMLTVKLSLVQ